MAQRPQLHEASIHQRREQRGSQRPHEFAPTTDRFEAGEPQQIFDIGYSKPVLSQPRTGKPKPSRRAQRKLPKPAVGVDDNPGARVRDARDLTQRPFDIPKIVNEVGKYDGIEWALDAEIVGIGTDEVEARMAPARTADHRGRVIDAHAI
jgi:hypothetical protein